MRDCKPKCRHVPTGAAIRLLVLLFAILIHSAAAFQSFLHATTILRHGSKRSSPLCLTEEDVSLEEEEYNPDTSDKFTYASSEAFTSEADTFQAANALASHCTVEEIALEDEISNSFLQYALSIILGRALARCAGWTQTGTSTHLVQHVGTGTDTQYVTSKVCSCGGRSTWQIVSIV